MTDPWKDMLTLLEPEYDQLKSILERGPTIIISLEKERSHWRISIRDDMTFDEFSYSDFDSKINQAINWTEDQLKSWPDVRRMAYDIWWFERRRDAEKFKTMFTLKWLT
jgi:hypothetical protein